MIALSTKDLHQIIVPIRFTRAITGFSERASPEVDDRGFAVGTRPSGWSSTDVRGPMVGLMVNFEVQVKVVREDIDDTAPLYVACTEPSVVQLVEPATGGPLPADGIFKIRGLTTRGSPGKIEVRLGSTTGPVLGELEPHVLGPFRIPIQPHRVRCDTAANTGARPNLPIERILRRVRAIWWPCGIHIVYDAATRPIQDDNITLNTLNQVRDPDVDAWAEVIRVLGLQRTRLGLAAGTNDRAINWYIIPRFSDATTVGLGVSRQTATAIGSDTGVFTTADGVTGNEREIERLARTLAHEIGHFLTLKHVQDRNADNAVTDTYGRRQLMYPISWLEAAVANPGLQDVPRTNDVGYGNEARGCLITMKNHAHHSTDGECATAIRTYGRGTWF
jgi:hypothetical protein